MATSGGERGASSLLVCRVGAKLCALPLGRLLETMRPLPTEPLSGMPHFVSGLARVRGRPTPVLDAREMLGSPSQHEPGRYITLDLTGDGQRVAALAVDAVVGVRDVPEQLLGALPSLLRGPRSDVVRAIGLLDAELLLVLEEARLVPEEVWHGLEQERAAP